jgi:hypothetical protein
MTRLTRVLGPCAGNHASRNNVTVHIPGERCAHMIELDDVPHELDDVIRWASSDGPKTSEQLHRAADVLGRHVRSGKAGVAEARVRVAVQLEQLGQ